MALNPENKNAIRERLSFYRELGIGPLYRREVSADASPEIDTASASKTEEEYSMAGVPQPTQKKGSFDSGGQLRAASAQDDTARVASAQDDRVTKLQMIADDIGPNCQRCKLARLGRKQIVFGTGDPTAELMFIGEGPGADEDEQGLPFVGRAGQLLNNMIAAMGLKREQVYIANIVKCRPPSNRTPERDECDTCSPFLMRQIRVVRPKVIVALGATAAKNLLAVNDSMASLRGRFYDFSPPRTSGDTDEPFDCKLAVTYHPAFLLRDPRQKSEAWKDLQMVKKYLGLTPSPKRQ
jgi:DNA polymerase